MRSLYLRIYLTVVLALGLFALVSGWLVQSHLDQERVRTEGAVRDRVAAWVELLQRSLPGPEAALDEQAQALREWSVRLRLPMALDDAGGSRIAASEAYLRREAEEGPTGRRGQAIKLDDGRTLWVMRPGALRNPGAGGLGVRAPGAPPPWWTPPRWFDSLNLAALLLVMFAAVAGGAWPVVRRLTRRLEALKSGVEAFGAGALSRRVPEEGRDEVAALATSFNQAAARIETLVKSHQSLLANASHEIRSPLARLKMAVSMMEDASPEARAALRQEIDTNIGELDALVEEVLMASRLDAKPTPDAQDSVDLLGLAAEEASRVQAQVQGDPVTLQAEERLVRRALRNLLENARRYGGDEVEVSVRSLDSSAEVRVCDRGPGVPEAYRERIFEAFFRLPGHAEREGGVGLGLALVRQIAERHGGGVRCEPRDGGGSCFVLTLPRRNAP